MELTQIVEKLGDLGEFFGTKLSRKRLELYAGMIERWPDEKITKGFDRAVLELDAFPSYAKLSNLAGATPPKLVL